LAARFAILTMTATRRLYYDDSFQRDFTAEIVACEPAPAAVAAARSSPAWGVLLDATSFYPTSGGQPHDLGCINDGSGEAHVLDVIDEGDTILHIIDRPLCKGRVEGHLDWPRRFDHMQQHTGQHLLSAIFQERFGLPTVSFHLGEELCTIDVHGPEPHEEILEGAQHAANKVVFENRAINTRYGTAQQLAERGVRKEVDRPGILRAIEIDGIDLQPCGGTHVKHTGQIGTILVRRCTKMKQDWRVEFVCGGRAERLAHRDFSLVRALGEKLSCPPEEIRAAVEKALTERDANHKESRALLQQLAVLEAGAAVSATPLAANGLRLVVRIFDGRTPSAFVGAFAAELAKHEKTVAVLARSECGHVFLAQHPSANRDMAALLKQLFEQIAGKGGGSRDSVRGKLADPAQAQRAVDTVAQMLAAH
jgi:alanyl-tRNA synthetase